MTGVVALALFAAGCGGSSGSEEFAQVRAELEQARAELDALKEQVAATTAAPTTTAAPATTTTPAATTSPPTPTTATQAPAITATGVLLGSIALGIGGNIFVMNADGTDVRQLTDNSYTEVELDSGTLIEQLGVRGTRVLVPEGWVPEFQDGGGSGSGSYWRNPVDSQEFVYAHTGVARSLWYEIDGVEGSITPTVPEGSILTHLSDSTFVYGSTTEEFTYKGVWKAWADNGGYADISIHLRQPDEALVAAFIDFLVTLTLLPLFRDTGASWSPDGNKIAFASDRDGDAEIFVMNRDGTGVTQLTHDNDHTDFGPVWSPDGNKIAYERRRIRYAEMDIVVMNADGTGAHQITDYKTTAPSTMSRMPTWSPDGRMIAFVREPWGVGDTEIFVMNHDGSGLVQLTNNDDNEWRPNWSPSTNKIAFTGTGDGDGEIFVMDADGDNIVQITDNEHDDAGPIWSPDGDKIAFTSDQDGDFEIFVMNADGSNVVSLGQQGSSSSWTSYSPQNR